MPPSVLALDIGGANLKGAHTAGVARTVPFDLWKQPAGLAAALRSLTESFPAFDAFAVTMTGELCDCYPTRRDGVLEILDSVAFVSQWLGKPAFVWRSDGSFADLAAARAEPLACAASNWLALATFAGRFAPRGHAMLLDVGSTTSDLIPLRDGVPIPAARTDLDRLRSGELVYTGVSRTPVCAVLGESVAAEWFATTLDVYLLLGDIAEDADDRRTADGRPATREHAHARLARAAWIRDLPHAARSERCATPSPHAMPGSEYTDCQSAACYRCRLEISPTDRSTCRRPPIPSRCGNRRCRPRLCPRPPHCREIRRGER